MFSMMEQKNASNLSEFTDQNKDQRKYLAVKRKCEEVQQTNEKLVNRICHVKKMIKRYRKERRLLQMKLDLHGDSYKEAELPVMWEEAQLYGAPAPPLSPHPEVKPPVLPDPVNVLTKSSTPSKTSKKKSTGEKKPPNAYIVFCQVQRSVIQKKYLQENQEEVSQTELTKLLSQEWNKLTPEKKKVYYEISDQRKQEAERKQAMSVQSHLLQVQNNSGGSSSTTQLHASMQQEFTHQEKT